MEAPLELLLRYGYLLLFGAILAEQFGVPIPATPVLLAMGALAGAGHFSLALCALIAAAAAVTGDLVWYLMGRRQGQSILRFLCQLSLEPDFCVHRTERLFGRYGTRALLVARFIPGYSMIAAPMAGLTKMPVGRFIAYAGTGTALWVGSLLLLGSLFRSQLEWILRQVSQFGWGLAVLVIGLMVVLGGWSLWQRQRYLRSLRMARIQPDELRDKICSGEAVVIIDLRHPDEYESTGLTLPGALRISPNEIEQRAHEVQGAAEIILYCS